MPQKAECESYHFGASGGIGRSILKAILSNPEFTHVRLILRSKISLLDHQKVEQVVVDFDRISDPEYSHLFKGFDVAFYSLGVYAGFVPKDYYLQVEHSLALTIGQLLATAGIPELHWVTAIGVSPKSPFLFGRVKAEVEESVGKMRFRRVAFYRPGGVLTSDGSGQFGNWRVQLYRLLDRGGWFTVDGDGFGQVMVNNALLEDEEGVEVFKNRDITLFQKLYL